jgi:hypothetical protein
MATVFQNDSRRPLLPGWRTRGDRTRGTRAESVAVLRSLQDFRNKPRRGRPEPVVPCAAGNHDGPRTAGTAGTEAGRAAVRRPLA